MFGTCGFGAAPAERRQAGVLDDVLVPLDPGIPGIRPCPTKRGHPTAVLIQPKVVAATAAVIVLAGKVMIGLPSGGDRLFPLLSARFDSTNPNREHKYIMLGVKRAR